MYCSLVCCCSSSHTQVPVPVSRDCFICFLPFISAFNYILCISTFTVSFTCFLVLFVWVSFNIFITTGYSLVIYVPSMSLYLWYNLLAVTATKMTFFFLKKLP